MRGAYWQSGLVEADLLGVALRPQVILKPLHHRGAGVLLGLEVGEEVLGVDHGWEEVVSPE